MVLRFVNGCNYIFYRHTKFSNRYCTNNGVSGNWVWWAFLITGLLTVFVYAKLWRKSNVNTDLEFYELRYGGKPAKFLRKFRALYLGVIFNVITMSAVTLAAIKIGGIMLGLEPWQTVIKCWINYRNF